MTMKHVRRAMVIAGMMLAAVQAYGQDCAALIKSLDAVPTDPDATLLQLARRECLGSGSTDGANSPTREYGTIGVRDARSLPARLAAAQRAAELLSQSIARQLETGTADADSWRAMATAVRATREQLGSMVANSDESSAVASAEALLTQTWGRPLKEADDSIVVDGQAIAPLAPTQCAPAKPCPVFASRVQLIRHIRLLARLQQDMDRDSLKSALAASRLALQRWEAYRSKGQHQFVWELFANSLRMGSRECPKDPATGLSMGFCSVPTSQLILLHPDAALVWRRSAQSSAELKPALAVELIGWYRWDWSGDTAAMKNRFGGSLVATYSGSGSEARWSYGPMLHWGDGYSLAFTKAGGQRWGLVVNVNLSNLLFAKKSSYVDAMKSLQRPGLADFLR